MIDYIKDIKKVYALNSIEIGEFSTVKVGPMKDKITAYEIPGIGQCSVMQGTAMFGMMKMTSLIITSFTKDIPLISIDRIQVMKNDTLIIEAYNTCKELESYPSLLKIKDKAKQFEKYPLKPAWYDEIRLPESLAIKVKGARATVDAIEEEYLQATLEILPQAKDISPEEKLPLQRKYTETLLSQGGTSTDQFLKAIGQQKTEELFRKYIFGTK